MDAADPKERDRRVRDLADLVELMAAEIARDGGTIFVTDVDYERGVVSVALGGACGTCSLTGATLQDGVVRILTQRLDWITEVRGTVDESSATAGFGGWQPR